MKIDLSKQLLQSAGDLSLFIASALKRGWKMSDMFKLVQMGSDIMSLVQQGKDILPELKDIDEKEAGELASLCYHLVKQVYDVASKA